MVRVVRKPGPGRLVLDRILENADGKVGKVGFFESAKYEDGTPVAYVAAIQEFGFPEGGIPSRSFMRTTIKAETKNWRLLAQSGARAILAGNYTIEQVLDGIGMQAAGDIRKTISKIWSPKLADATIAARVRKRADGKTVGNLNKPLVDSGYMLSQVSHTVEDSR